MTGGDDVLALVQRVAQAPGPAPFFAVGSDTFTGAAFARAVLQCAAGLARAGFGRGDRLAIHLHRCGEEAIALCAAAIAGGIAVPIHPKQKDAQVAHVLADCEPWAVVTSATKGALLNDAAAVFAGQRVFAVAAAPPGVRAEPFVALLADANANGPRSRPAPDDAAILLYTSGSTGLAKGVVQTHENLALGARLVAEYLGLRAHDHILGVLPFSFDYGLNQLLAAMHVGCRITAADFLAIGELAALLRRVRPTGLAGVPSLWHEVGRGLQQGVLAAGDGESLRYVTNSGGRLAADDIRTLRSHWPHVQVFAMYGLTEAFRSAYLPPSRIDDHPDSFGTALPGVELLLVDPDRGHVIEGPGTGELVHAGALVSRGYWRRPEATAERFRPDPRGGGGTVVYSGDLVRRDEEGLLYFVARRDRMLKVAGHRISPDEVAQAVVGERGIGLVAVFGEEPGVAGHRIVLCAEGDPRDGELPQRLQQLCRARLPAYMVPARIVVLASLPRTANGKVDVVRLQRDLDSAGGGACTADR